MIRRIEAWSSEVDKLCARDVYGTRTIGYYRTYGFEHPTVSFYAQVVNGTVTSVFSSAFGNGSLTVLPDADCSEWEQFVHFLGMETILCSRETAAKMGFSDADAGFVMQYEHCDRTPLAQIITPYQVDFSYREVYELLLECGFSLGEFTLWLDDFALRVRRHTANVLCVREQKSTVSTASVLFESEDAVYLGAVATHPSVRGRGLGGDLVLRHAQCGKRAEILCKPQRVSFYESLGFRQNGEFVLCHFSA